MKIEIEKKDLINLIGKTQNIVEKRNTMPVLVNILLETDKNRLRVFATDLEVSLTDVANVKVITEGKVAVSAKNLFDITKELLDGPIHLLKKENNWLEIKQGKYHSKIVGISADEYPVFPAYKGQNFIKMDAMELRDMIDKTIYSICTDETRYHLNGVYFEQKSEGNYIMVATDGHRMSLIHKEIATTNKLSASGANSGVIIPKKGLFEIKKMIDAIDGTIEVAIEGSQIIVKNNETILMTRLIEGKFPNYQQFIPQKLTQKISINREMFLSSLKRVSLLANYKSKAVTLSLSKGKMEITSNNPELGDAKEELEVTYDGKDLKIGFNAKYITDVLTAIKDEEIDFEINDQLSPGLMRPHNDKNYTCVVMPMRI